MKKFILSAVAVAAFAVGGVAQADVIDSVGNTISRIFGIPYDPTPPGAVASGRVYTDAYGRRFHVDQWGRTVYLGGNDQPLYVDRNGQLVPYAGGNYAMGPTYDQDGDGFANQYDRYPNDPRYR